jgi:hypothetical protein
MIQIGCSVTELRMTGLMKLGLKLSFVVVLKFALGSLSNGRL